MVITDYKVSESYSGRDISSLSDRPNEDGLSASALKARFDQLGKEVIPNYNDLIDLLNSTLFMGSSTENTGHTHNADILVDGLVKKILTAVERTKLEGIETGAEVNQFAFSKVKVGSNEVNAVSKTDVFELAGGLNVSIDVNPTTKVISLSATGELATDAIQSYIVDLGNYFTSLNVEGALQEVGAKLSPSASKTTPVDADTLLIADSEASNVFKKLSWSNIKAILKTYFDGIYATISNLNLKAPIDNPTFTGLITTGGQIKFPAVQVPSADANTLDDYEEGTFTPFIYGETTAGVGTYSAQDGRYIKIGNVVTIHIYLAWTAHTGTGNMRLGGLPFNVSGNGALALGIFGSIPLTADNFPTLHALSNYFRFRQSPITGGTSVNVPITSVSTGLAIGGNYLTL